ncbi:MAG TPA: sensor histidine kinase [Actinomycetota bacterium]|nr:sensor histidine kinase [Actinomycetota bacterium]
MTVEQVATGGPGGGTVGRVLAPLRQVRTLTATIYLLLSMFVGLTWHVILAVGLTVGVGTLIIWVGVFVLALTLLAWRGGAWLERRWVGAMLGVHIPDPYRPLPDGSLWRRARVLASDPATWKDLAYLVVLFPLGLIWFVVTTTVWTLALGLLTAPLWYWIPADGAVALFENGDRSYLVLDTLPEAILAGVAGAALCVAAAWVVRGMAIAHGAVALALLGPSQNQLQARVEALQTSRDRAVDSAEAERRRIERDLHDGAQQRLVALAMDLGMARAKLETDPAAATALVGEAHEEAKRALAELRDLARGIHPAVLADRGLDAAISALAARSPVPVGIDVATGRLPDPVESAAYFVVAEALTNAAKHARAAEIGVRITRHRDLLVVEVIDDGAGGADPARGTGLRGLADRVAAVDGHLTVTSPPGGPTVIRAELPCGS